MIFVFGCTVLTVPANHPLPVSIEAMPFVYRSACFVEEPPSPPADLKLDFEVEDVIRRTTVNIRQYNDMLKWARDLAVWVSDMNNCMAKMIGGTRAGGHSKPTDK